MNSMISLFIFLPLLSSIVAGIGCFFRKSKFIAYLCCMFIFFAFVYATLALYFLDVANHKYYIPINIMPWMDIVNVRFSFMVDEISCIMSCVVLFVSFLVHIYSIFYMEHDKDFNKFFAYLGLFVFSMLVLVLSDNFLLLFVGWEGVGLCSWLLIGFWYNNDKYSYASNEAFIMNRVADFAMLIGIFYIYVEFGTLKYNEVFMQASSSEAIKLIAILLFVGAMGKSAQFPFHTWLADAMAGPTPVSALIHSSTMVTAGVYLLIRTNEIFSQAVDVLYFVACVGAFVAIFAASMALVAHDLKRIIAYSTLSQLGYMFVACGLGAYSLAFFHLVTHAFFKSLLFLGAGNVMHAMNDKLDIRKMGGLYKSMKVTAIFVIVGSVALSGIYPFAGFFSKDKIVDFALVSGHFWLYLVLLITAFFTAFYSFRLVMRVFFAKTNHEEYPHEASKLALFAMSPLALLAIIAGFFENSFFAYIESIFKLELHHDMTLIAISLAVAIFGIVLAVVIYKYDLVKPSFENNFFYKILANDYYIPQIYHAIFVKGFEKIANFLGFVEKNIVDGVVKVVSFSLHSLARVCEVRPNLSNMIYYYVGGVLALMMIAIVVFLVKTGV